ncbi:MAG: uroporphyrinogen decarboxylase family protein [Armatimonadota bacterium]|nr:uroporphyrinogen decarboxylase family protein [Armatimonadota bacterium]
MSPRERIIAAIEHRETEYVPYAIPIDPEVVERLNAHYGSEHWRKRIHSFVHSAGVQWRDGGPGDGRWTDKFGVVWEDAPGPGAWHSVQVPLTEPTLEGYQFPELLTDEELEELRERFSGPHEQYRMVGMGMLFFERSWALRGMNNILMDFHLHPGFAHELFERLMQVHLDLTDRLAELPIDAIRFGDDFGAQSGLIMGIPIWRKFLKPRLARIYGRAHDHGFHVWIHSCGDNSPIIEDLIEIGVDVFNPFQPEAQDVYRMKRRVGDRIAFEGGIGTQEQLPRWRPGQIRAEIRRLVREVGADGGFIISPTKPIMPDVPTENAVACIEEILAQAKH